MNLSFWLKYLYFYKKNKWGVNFFAIFRKVTFLSLFVILIVGFQCKIKHLESIWDHPVFRLNSNIRFLKLLLEFSGKRKEVEINQSISLSHTYMHNTHKYLAHVLSVSSRPHKLSFFFLILRIILSRTFKNGKIKLCLHFLMEDTQFTL